MSKDSRLGRDPFQKQASQNPEKKIRAFDDQFKEKEKTTPRPQAQPQTQRKNTSAVKVLHALNHRVIPDLKAQAIVTIIRLLGGFRN